MLIFFFSSRRRHTRFDCDWSSDVCSSDLAGNDRLAAHGALGGRVDVAREAPGTVRHALEAREARDVDDIRAAFALHDVEPEEIDSECRSATSRDVLELGSEGERVTPLFLGSAPRANPDYAEPFAPERVDLAVRRPVRRVVALGEYRLLHGPERRQLGGVRDHRTAPQPGAARSEERRVGKECRSRWS